MNAAHHFRERRNTAKLHNNFIAVVQIFKLLRIITDVGFRSPDYFACKFHDGCQNRLFKERRLSRSVSADYSETFTADEA
jgi:hypothetical protein